MFLTTRELHGIFVPIVTPFHSNGELDLESFRQLVQQLIRDGIHGLVVNGTTGESPAIEADEVKQLMAAANEAALALAAPASNRIPIVLGTGTNSTASTIKRTEQAGNYGADAALVVVPYYNRPSQQGIIEHFRSLGAVGIPVILYDIPHRTGITLEVNTVRTIMEMDHVIGLKDSTGSIKLVSELSRLDAKPVLCGDDEFFFASLCCGARGGMMASANVNTAQFVQVYEHYTAGRVQEAKQSFEELLPLVRLLFAEPNPSPIKWLLEQRQLISSDAVRLPMMGISEHLQQQLAKLPW